MMAENFFRCDSAGNCMMEESNAPAYTDAPNAPTANGTTLIVANGAKVLKNDAGGVMIGDRLAQMVGGS
jgi:hypothetical protein